ncbi:Unknown protein, partial [Striga hermonthica]
PLTLNPEHITCQRQDHLLASWILSSLGTSILPLMVGLSNSKDIWSALQKNFSSQSLARVMQYKMEMQNLKKGSLTMKEYISKMKSLFDALAAAGHVVSEKDQIMHLIGGLGQEYNPIMVTVSSRVEPWSTIDLQALLLSFESRLETVGLNIPLVNSDGSYPMANAAMTQNFPRNASQNRGGRAPFNQSFRGRGGRGPNRGRGGRFSKPKIQCQVCGVNGHTAERCWYRYDTGYMGSALENSSRGFNSPSANMMHTQHLTPSEAATDSNQWYPDSGATNHVTNNFTNLSIASEYGGGSKLHMGNGSGENISHIGKTLLKPHHSTRIFVLKDLLHVPSVTKNLLSVSKFALDNNVYFEFHPFH